MASDNVKPEWQSADGSVVLFRGDCLEVLRTMTEASVDAIVTDPPYALTPGKASKGGFMGLAWDSALPPVEMWQEALRVAKPGAHLLAFGGTRTYHRLVCSIEDAGWEVRDAICWLYGQGMPKSRNLNGRWKGWGTGLKPSVEFIVLARKPLARGLTVAKNVQEFGTGAINIDACRISRASKTPFPVGATSTDGVVKTGFHNKPRSADSNPTGSWPSNVILGCDCTHDGHEADCPVRMLDEQSGSGGSGAGKVKVSAGTKQSGTWSELAPTGQHAAGRVNVGVRDFGDFGGASRFFYTAKPARSEKDDGLEVEDEFPVTESIKWAGNGGIAKQFREHGWSKMRNTHATVKAVALMEYLVRLVTPPGGVVLDPFLGSGTTAVACAKHGFRCVGIDLDPTYAKIAVARVRRAREKSGTLAATEAKGGQQVGLFATLRESAGDGSGPEGRVQDVGGTVDRSGTGPGAGG